jgi:hypothetical protein
MQLPRNELSTLLPDSVVVPACQSVRLWLGEAMQLYTRAMLKLYIRAK